jgi:hypothetical protein
MKKIKAAWGSGIIYANKPATCARERERERERVFSMPRRLGVRE